MTPEPVTRCEINTYIIDSTDNIGTLILDYASSQLSLDSFNLIKMADKHINYTQQQANRLTGYVKQKNIDFNYTNYLSNLLYY